MPTGKHALLLLLITITITNTISITITITIIIIINPASGIKPRRPCIAIQHQTFQFYVQSVLVNTLKRGRCGLATQEYHAHHLAASLPAKRLRQV
ncbi:hypothetical protein E2C01_089674 [Portunus trituberculatus]|uniref:Uncharacterized protein n=1 Tax=Portunus trituberculatus TaxID=210409 RepID=A0A5B7JJF1_PORTR|nr:hypothetical protein [Portunus trituberculatus]